MPDTLHLVRIPVDSRRLYAFARQSKLGGRELDEGYAVHALFSALFDHEVGHDDRVAPKPFHLGDTDRRVLIVLGYSRASDQELRARATRYSDPLAFDVCHLEQIATRPMPTNFPAGSRVAFYTRICPTRRIKKRGPMEAESAEVDAFLAKAWAVGDSVQLDRERVYIDWLSEELGRSRAATLEEAGMSSFRLGRFVRKTQGEERRTKQMGRPDVVLEGVLRVTDPDAFGKLLARGVGRHRAFGFGMVLLRPAPRER